MKTKKKNTAQNKRYPLMPKPAVFKKKTDYDRKRVKTELRKMLMKGE